MILGYIALFSWPLVAIVLFRRFGVAGGIAWTIIGGYLLLPSKPVINPPLLPNIDKDTIPAVAALILALVFARGDKGTDAPVMLGWIPRPFWARACLLMLILGAFVTVFLNDSGFSFGPRRLPGLRPYDAFSTVMLTFVGLLPFFLARKYLARPEAHKALLVALCAAALFYSLPTLYEVRMSPQLNKMIYGFFPHDWAQHTRSGGFRPLVFLHHGLWLAIFLCCACLAAVGLARQAEGAIRMRWLMVAGWLLGTIVLAKSLGALMIVVLIAPVIFLTRAKLQMTVAAAIAAIVLAYPVLRGADLIPVNAVLSLVEKIDVRRAGSLQFRLENEDILLDKANAKPMFGWGGWGRARVFNEKGEDLSTTDGYWILTIGEGGWIRYLSEFGLLAIATIMLAMRARAYDVDKTTTALCLVLSANLLDIIPNAGVTPATWLLAGAVLGRFELGRIAGTAAASTAEDPRRASYQRKEDPPPDAPLPEPGVTATPRSPTNYARQRPVHRRERISDG